MPTRNGNYLIHVLHVFRFDLIESLTLIDLDKLQAFAAMSSNKATGKHLQESIIEKFTTLNSRIPHSETHG